MAQANSASVPIEAAEKGEEAAQKRVEDFEKGAATAASSLEKKMRSHHSSTLSQRRLTSLCVFVWLSAPFFMLL